MKQKKPKVYPFGEDQLVKAIRSCHKGLSEDEIKSKITFQYIIKYFGYEFSRNGETDQCKANTIVLEHNYISQSYLTDYINYHSSSFKKVRKFTSRIHFFNETFNQEEFEKKILQGTDKDDKKFWSSYLGYIIIRPLISSPFGAFIFKPYSNVFPYRKRFVNSKLNKLRFDVFGKKVEMQALAFQQQDKVVGACATFAIWSAFHKLSEMYKIPLPSPYEITEKAGISVNYSNLVAVKGLTANQIISVFEKSNISCQAFSVNPEKVNHNTFKEIIYAYNKAGVPLLLGYNFSKNSYKFKGKHLVTIVGYRLNSEIKPRKKKDQIKLVAHDLMRFYAHDDLFGPYSKVDIVLPLMRSFQLKTNQLGFEKFAMALPDKLWIPLDPLIRVKYSDVLKAVKALDQAFYKYSAPEEWKDSQWDIYLNRAVDYKQKFIHFDFIDNEFKNNIKKKIRYTSYPKYVWVASLLNLEGQTFLDLIYDASSLPGHNCIFQVNCFDVNIRNFINKNSEVFSKDSSYANLKTYNKFID